MMFRSSKHKTNPHVPWCASARAGSGLWNIPSIEESDNCSPGGTTALCPPSDSAPPLLLCTCPTSLHVLLSGLWCCWRPIQVALRKVGVFAFPSDLNGSFERQRLSLHIPTVRIESILRSVLGGGEKKRGKILTMRENGQVQPSG